MNLIHNKFSVSFMSNSKWIKLIEGLTDTFEEIYVRYKLIYSEEIKDYIFYATDFEPFFIEPIVYKEVEWIEIPLLYEDWVNENNRKAGKKMYSQKLDDIKSEICKIGAFEMDITKKSIRIYGHKI